MLIEHKLSNISKIGKSNLIGKDTFFKNISTDTRVLTKGDILAEYRITSLKFAEHAFFSGSCLFRVI